MVAALGLLAQSSGVALAAEPTPAPPARGALGITEIEVEPALSSAILPVVANAGRVLYEEARGEWLVLAAALVFSLGYRGGSWAVDHAPRSLTFSSMQAMWIDRAELSALRLANTAYFACLVMLAYRLAKLLGW
jgi:hypothetical protein